MRFCTKVLIPLVFCGFFFAGQVGDWVNTFSQEQSHNFDVVYASKMADSMLTFVWEAKKSNLDTEILPLSYI